LPPDVREWLSGDDLAWFVIDAVDEMDLSGFYAAYRADGHGRAACEPSLMVALILYAFATGVRSSRAIERHCRRDVAYRVIAGDLVPDHVTIARFVCRHERALADLFAEVLRLCDRAGLVGPGVVSIDGTRIAGNASPEVNYGFDQIAREILAEARATDEAEDESSARRGAMSCPNSCAPRRGGASSCAGPAGRCAARKRALSRAASPRRRRPTRCRLSSTRRRSSGVGGRGGMRGCGRASASSSSTAGRTPRRSPAGGVSGC
jgi:transposase